MEQQSRPEPMNASPHHSKVRVSLTMGHTLYVAGGNVSGKMEMECRADKGLGIGAMMVELIAIQELTSRDHSATSTFLRSRRRFQGPGLPPSNAVQAHPLPGDPPLPPNYYQARRGVTTFLFRIPLPASSPSSINFGAGIARVRYEVQASVQVAWKGENKLVTAKREIDVVESFEEDFGRSEPEAVSVGENGKIWIQGKVVGGVVVAGESGCVELMVKNHSTKKNTGLTISLTRHLHLPGSVSGSKPPLEISDTLITVPYKGQEYIIPPGAEGVASLVFDVPQSARGLKGGTRDDDDGRTSEALFEVRCIIGVKLTMGLGSKDINLDIPVTVAHPAALPALPEPVPYAYPSSPPEHVPMPPASVPLQAPYVPPHNPYGYPAHPMSPAIPAYIDQSHVWLPPPGQPINYGQSYNYLPHPGPAYEPFHPHHLSSTPAPLHALYTIPPRPSSAGPGSASHVVAGLPPTSAHNPLLPLDTASRQYAGPEEGKGERASRITQHLRLSSRHRSVSPQSHRFPMPHPEHIVTPNDSHVSIPAHQVLTNLSPPMADPLSLSPPETTKVVHSPRPLLSPKHSFTVDPLTKHSITKSERVEALERMADAVDEEAKDLSADIPKTTPPSTILNIAPADVPSPDANVNKTLPTLPPPSLKPSIFSPLSESRPRADRLFVPSTSRSLELPQPEPLPSDQAPPTPTLTAVHSAKRAKSKDYLLGSTDPTESGLDALERRLLAEVGTRKQETSARPDVRTVLPIAIPPANTKPEPLNDSAISSLSLADHGGDLGIDLDDWDDRTHKAGKSSLSGDDKEQRDRDKDKDKDRDYGSGGRMRNSGKAKSDSGKQKDGEKRRKKGKDAEVHKMRKAAKGRVAAWLGGIEADVPPLDGSPPSGPGLLDEPRPPAHDTAAEPETVAEAPVNVDTAKVDTPELPSQESERPEAVSSIPNPRSSGFVPIGTFKREPFQRYPTGRGGPPVNPAAEEAKSIADLWSNDDETATTLKTKPFALRSAPAAAAQTIRTETRVSPPSSSTLRDEIATRRGRLPFQIGGAGARNPPLLSPPSKVQPSQRLPVFPSPARQDPEVKYDVRSARGGRGGQVTAVAAIWGAGAFNKNDDLKSGNPKPAPLPRKPSLPPVAQRKPTTPRIPPRLASRPPLLLSAAKKPGSSAASSDGSASTAEPDIGGKRVIKSASVPATVSSSLATPVLSSTASLARPVTAAKAKPASKVPPSNGVNREHPRVSGPLQQQPPTPQGSSGRNVPVASGTKPELAFGQARLRDLIRKYQGQAT